MVFLLLPAPPLRWPVAARRERAGQLEVRDLLSTRRTLDDDGAADVSDAPDIPHDPNLPHMAGKRIREGGGMFSRELKAIAATRRHRAERVRRRGDEEGAGREEHDAAYL